MQSGAAEQRIVRLSRRQKECLELVAQGYTSKQIGRKLGISYSTVDNHIQVAIQVLEVDGRAEAGRLYAQLSGEADRQRMPSQLAGLAGSQFSPDEMHTTHSGGWRRILTSFVPPVGGKENALSPSQTVLAIFRIGFLAALVFIACVMIVKMSFRALT